MDTQTDVDVMLAIARGVGEAVPGRSVRRERLMTRARSSAIRTTVYSVQTTPRLARGRRARRGVGMGKSYKLPSLLGRQEDG